MYILIAEPSEGAVYLSNKTRVHTLVFNVSSVSREEALYLGELRLYTLVEADRNQYLGVDRVVTVYEVFPSGRHRRDVQEMQYTDSLTLISSRHIYGRYSGWETFEVTEAVKKWIKSRKTTQILEVRIDTVTREGVGDLDITTRPNKDKGPLLVVFSNDPRRRRSENRELHEIISHEMDLSDVSYYDEHLDDDEEYYEDDEYEENYIDSVEEKGDIYKRDTSRQMQLFERNSSTSRQW